MLGILFLLHQFTHVAGESLLQGEALVEVPWLGLISLLLFFSSSGGRGSGSSGAGRRGEGRCPSLLLIPQIAGEAVFKFKVVVYWLSTILFLFLNASSKFLCQRKGGYKQCNLGPKQKAMGGTFLQACCFEFNFLIKTIYETSKFVRKDF